MYRLLPLVLPAVRTPRYRMAWCVLLRLLELPAMSETRSAKRHRERKAAGLCRSCGQCPPRKRGLYLCAKCLEDRRERRRVCLQFRICVNCETSPAAAKHTMCRPCMERKNDRAREVRARRFAEGKCRDCSRPAVEGKTKCTKCAEKARERAKFRYHLHRLEDSPS